MGTVSKWRVRYARDRLAGLDETAEIRAGAPEAHSCHARSAAAEWLLELNRTPLARALGVSQHLHGQQAAAATLPSLDNPRGAREDSA
jgi:hypothetical protein